jgi:plasmid stability protein
LTEIHTIDTVSHMKTTLQIDDGVMRDLKMRAARDGRTMSELVETALRRLLEERPAEKDLPRLPVMVARELVDVSDRDALYRAMEEP